MIYDDKNLRRKAVSTYITKINHANTRNNNYQQNSNKRFESPINTNKTDNISFGINPLAGAVIKKTLTGLWSALKIGAAKDAALELMEEGNIVAGLEVTIEIQKKLQAKRFQHIANSIDELLDSAAHYAERLSDNTFENRDTKQKFLESVFWAQSNDHPVTAFDGCNNDNIPESCRDLFLGLNRSVYGQFRANLVKKAVLEKNVALKDPESLMDDIKDRGLRQRIIDRAEELAKNAEPDRTDYPEIFE